MVKKVPKVLIILLLNFAYPTSQHTHMWKLWTRETFFKTLSLRNKDGDILKWESE